MWIEWRYTIGLFELPDDFFHCEHSSFLYGLVLSWSIINFGDSVIKSLAVLGVKFKTHFRQCVQGCWPWLKVIPKTQEKTESDTCSIIMIKEVLPLTCWLEFNCVALTLCTLSNLELKKLHWTSADNFCLVHVTEAKLK